MRFLDRFVFRNPKKDPFKNKPQNLFAKRNTYQAPAGVKRLAPDSKEYIDRDESQVKGFMRQKSGRQVSITSYLTNRLCDIKCKQSDWSLFTVFKCRLTRRTKQMAFKLACFVLKYSILLIKGLDPLNIAYKKRQKICKHSRCFLSFRYPLTSGLSIVFSVRRRAEWQTNKKVTPSLSTPWLATADPMAPTTYDLIADNHAVTEWSAVPRYGNLFWVPAPH